MTLKFLLFGAKSMHFLTDLKNPLNQEYITLIQT